MSWSSNILFFNICAVVSTDTSAAQADELRRESAGLEREIAQLEREMGRLRCEAAPPPPAPPQPPEEEEPEEDRTELPEPEVPPEPIQEPQKARCAPTERAVEPTEIVFVFDTSGSMEYSIDLPASIDRELSRLYNQLERERKAAAGGGFGALLRIAQVQAQYDRLTRRAASVRGRERLAVARDVTIDAITQAPQDLSIGLVSFNQCNSRRHGTFQPGQRNNLIRTVRRLKAEDSTPLARAIQAAASSFDGGTTADDPVNMVVISDGQDSCNGNPCNAARRAKGSKPGLVINVVDLSKAGDLRCVAERTGGFYRRHDEGMKIADLSRSVREAAGYEGEGLCRE